MKGPIGDVLAFGGGVGVLFPRQRGGRPFAGTHRALWPELVSQQRERAFRTFVREEMQNYPLFDDRPDHTYETIEALAREVQTKL